MAGIDGMMSVLRDGSSLRRYGLALWFGARRRFRELYKTASLTHSNKTGARSRSILTKSHQCQRKRTPKSPFEVDAPDRRVTFGVELLREAHLVAGRGEHYLLLWDHIHRLNPNIFPILQFQNR